LAVVTFAALLIGTVAAFAAVQDLKRTGTVFDRLDVTRKFSPNGDGFKDEARIAFRLTRPDRVDLEIVTEDDRPVEALADDIPLRSYFLHEFVWDGLQQDGERWPLGRYKILVRLEGQRRTITPAVTIELRRRADEE
jgi:hypothetical protein